MKGEIPMFRRCCFCFPLRYGLLVWGYFKLIADAFILTFLSLSITWTVNAQNTNTTVDDFKGSKIEDHVELHKGIYQSMIIPVIALAVFVADFMVTLVFIIGGHQKNLQLIRVFYFSSIAMWIFTSLVTTLSVVVLIHSFAYIATQFWLGFVLTFSFYFVFFGVQTYFIFLLRNEVNKLKNSNEVRFVNNEVEAECIMKSEGTREETETEDV